jgi:hypothetical protein
MGLGELIGIPLGKIPYVKEWAWLQYVILDPITFRELTRIVSSTSNHHGGIFEKWKRDWETHIYSLIP